MTKCAGTYPPNKKSAFVSVAVALAGSAVRWQRPVIEPTVPSEFIFIYLITLNGTLPDIAVPYEPSYNCSRIKVNVGKTITTSPKHSQKMFTAFCMSSPPLPSPPGHSPATLSGPHNKFLLTTICCALAAEPRRKYQIFEMDRITPARDARLESGKNRRCGIKTMRDTSKMGDKTHNGTRRMSMIQRARLCVRRSAHRHNTNVFGFNFESICQRIDAAI